MCSSDLYAVALTCLTLTLPGCLSRPYLGNGEPSGLLRTSALLRDQLVPTPVAGTLPAYRPVRCVFDERMTGAVSTSHKKITLSIESVAGNKLFVRMAGPQDEGTILMDRTGRLLDTNVLTVDTAQRLTPEDYDPYAEKYAKNFHSILSKDPHILNMNTATFPHFIGMPSRPGVRVADVLIEKNEVWGFYVYRGMLTYHGVRAELLDLMHTQNGRVVVRGFLLFDTQHMLPLLFNLTMGLTSGYEFEQLECPTSPAASAR